MSAEVPIGSFATEMWRASIHKVPGPAALIRADGLVFEVNDDARAAAPGLITGCRVPAPAPTTVGEVGPPVTMVLPPEWQFEAVDAAETLFLASGPSPDQRGDVRDQLLKQFFATDGVLFVVADQDGTVLQTNEAWDAEIGVGAETGANFWALVDPDGSGAVEEIERALRRSGGSRVHLAMFADKGARERRDVDWSLSTNPDSGLMFGVGRDITDQLLLTERLRQLAYTDDLTGLANRTKLIEVIDSHLAGDRRPAVLFCDLDRFKVVNDSLGHRAGDEVLRLLGERLRQTCARAGRRPGDCVVGRLGGDEFVVVVASADRQFAGEVAEQVLETISEPFSVYGRAVRIGMSVGISVAHAGVAYQSESLLGEADTAAYYAKDHRRGGYVVHDENLQGTLVRRFNIEAGLIRALEEDRLEVHYQPVVALPSRRIAGVEALVRWRDDRGVLHFPDRFLDVAEDAGLIGAIGDFVLQRATADIAALGSLNSDLRLAVNATAGQVASPDFVEKVSRALKHAGLESSKLTIELTESAMLSNLAETVPSLEALRERGVQIAVDDFGTGYSSLSYLQELPLDVVKIDRTFVARMAADPIAKIIVSTIVELATALDLAVVAEGIETDDQASLATQLGCRNAQGFLFHRPMDLDQLRAVCDRARAI